MHHAFEVDRVGSGDVEVGQGIAHAGGDNQATTSGVNNIKHSDGTLLHVALERTKLKDAQQFGLRLGLAAHAPFKAIVP